jgi:hypothetical protein
MRGTREADAVQGRGNEGTFAIGASQDVLAASLRARVTGIALLVPGVALAAAVLVAHLDVRIALLASVVVIGWTQLVGL